MKTQLQTNAAALIVVTVCLAGAARATEYHVAAASGGEGGDGSSGNPFRTISAAAAIAMPGDTITVRAGVYREEVSPPRGGLSDKNRIVYRAAPGEDVRIKGSEVVKGWMEEQAGVWKLVLPNEFFGGFNPYSDVFGGNWFDAKGRQHHTGAVYRNGQWLWEAASVEDVMAAPGANGPFWWHATVSDKETTIRAQFPGFDPAKEEIEINVRQTVFYPRREGVDYLTVRGFKMMHAAAPWSPPTVEQIGLIGTHWSRGWIIEDNEISYSTGAGITLGKYGDARDHTTQQTVEGYVGTIRNALDHGWSKETIGSHLVRNNRIHHCEQAGIVGSMGGAFCTITGNVLHDIYVKRLFAGAEMGGIKLHAPIDTVIEGNHIFRCYGSGGIWLDWMAQGTRVSRNLVHDCSSDLFVEVNHGPYLVDNNVFLSGESIWDWSQGGAFVHNLVRGIVARAPQDRETPFHKPHSSELAGMARITGGDNRFYNNIFAGPGNLSIYDDAARGIAAAGNVYLGGARPAKVSADPVHQPDHNPDIRLEERDDGFHLSITLDRDQVMRVKRQVVATDLLGKAQVPQQGFTQPDGLPCRFDRDYFCKPRDPENPFPGPFGKPDENGRMTYKVWPVVRSGRQ